MTPYVTNWSTRIIISRCGFPDWRKAGYDMERKLEDERSGKEKVIDDFC
jgi:hypothetical protein